VPSIAETAYPRLKNQISTKELLEVYTPTEHELKLADRQTKGAVAKLGFLVLLKTFQRLGYFILVKNVPTSIIKHIAGYIKIYEVPQKLDSYDSSGTRWRHLTLIRDYLKIKPYGVSARRVIVKSIAEAARTKNDLADLINVAIEELVHHQYELPIFNSLVRAARRVRTAKSRSFYRQITSRLNLENLRMLDSIFEMNILNQKTSWSELKQDPGKPILKKMKKKVNQEKVVLIKSLLKERLKPINLLDLLTDTEIWLNWTQFFKPISGHEAKIAHPIERYLATTFCYGCNLGPSQTARSLGDFDHRQVAWVNQRHITEETLEKAITWIINAYNRFP
jgi:hypothetical protein